MEVATIKSGWQTTVHFHADHVIKILKNYSESRARIAPYLRYKGKGEKDIDAAARQAIEDARQALKIIAASKCPRQLLGNPEFLDATRFKQDKAIDLVEIIREQIRTGTVDSAKPILMDGIDFILELWRYGIYEKTYKLDSFGYVGARMILIDFLELSDDLAFIERQLVEMDWSRVCHRYRLPNGLGAFFLREASKRLTMASWTRNWKTKV